LLVFLGIEEADGADDIGWLAAKIVNLRLFDDSNGVMNLSAAETGKETQVDNFCCQPADIFSPVSLFYSEKNKQSWPY
jgi:D-Tyr-tRNAtyr deacylase